ncbi:MAG TPA: zf-HC2 domain-containing protein [bacterium]|nr:zf-HC2 domain-containing protein [bacterium]
MEQHCSEEILSAYLDGDLDGEAAGRAAEHIAECTVCRRSLAQVRAIRDAAPEMEQFVPSGRTWSGVQERIRGSKAHSRRLTRLFWVGLPALAVVLLVVFLAGVIRTPSQPTVSRWLSSVGRKPSVSELSRDKAAQEAAQEYGEYVQGIEQAIQECRTAMDQNPGNARVRAAYVGATGDRQRAMDRFVSGGY